MSTEKRKTKINRNRGSDEAAQYMSTILSESSFTRKPQIVLGFFGPTRHGKSCIAGRLINETGMFDQKSLSRLEEHALELLRPKDDKFALIFDRLRLEEEGSYSVVAYSREINTDRFLFGVFVSPGRLKFVKTISRVGSMVDLPIFVVSAGEKTSIKEIPLHLQLINGTSVGKHMILIISKLDLIPIDKQRERFQYMKDTVVKIIKKHSRFDVTHVIPQGLNDGINKGFFPDEKDLLSSINETAPIVHSEMMKDYNKEELIFFISNSHNICGPSTVVVGKMISGNEDSFFQREFCSNSVLLEERDSIPIKFAETHHLPGQLIFPPAYIGLNIKNISSRDFRKGYVIYDKTRFIKETNKLLAEISLVCSETTIQKGSTARLMGACKSIQVKVEKITSVLTKTGQTAVVTLHLLSQQIFSRYSHNKQLGKFILVDHNRVMANGIILGVGEEIKFLEKEDLILTFMMGKEDVNSILFYVPKDIFPSIIHFVFGLIKEEDRRRNCWTKMPRRDRRFRGSQ